MLRSDQYTEKSGARMDVDGRAGGFRGLTLVRKRSVTEKGIRKKLRLAREGRDFNSREI